MVKQFQFAKLPKIIFRDGAITGLPDQILAFGKQVALVTGKKSFANSPEALRLFNEFEKKAIRWSFYSIPGEPSPDEIDRYAARAASENIEVVVAIGGGSVLDAGKAISAMAGMDKPVQRFLESVGDLEHPGTRMPLIAVPTTSGTGSEATKNAVISKTGKDGFKKSLRHDNFVPDLALIDTGLTKGCPRDITAASGMDCFTQLTEAYLSDKALNYTDALAMEGLRAVRDYLEKCVCDGSDMEARAGMSFAALTSGICLANAGLGVVHGFASSVGGLFEIPHGVVCGSLMAKANEVAVRELRKMKDNNTALKKYSQLGRLFVSTENKPDDYYIDAFIGYIAELTSALEIPGFAGYGIGEIDIPEICRITENKNNPVKLGETEMAEILSSRLF